MSLTHFNCGAILNTDEGARCNTLGDILLSIAVLGSSHSFAFLAIALQPAP